MITGWMALEERIDGREGVGQGGEGDRAEDDRDGDGGEGVVGNRDVVDVAAGEEEKCGGGE